MFARILSILITNLAFIQISEKLIEICIEMNFKVCFKG